MANLWMMSIGNTHSPRVCAQNNLSSEAQNHHNFSNANGDADIFLEMVITPCLFPYLDRPGHFANVTKLPKCYTCEPGSFSNTSAAFNCTKCAPGHHQNADGKDSCQPCETGTEARQVSALSGGSPPLALERHGGG